MAQLRTSRHLVDHKQRACGTSADYLKVQLRDYWQASPCGEIYGQGEELQERLERHRLERYRLEPYIFDFAKFEEGAGRDVLEIGVGMGADHLEWARNRPRSLTGVDLTPAAIAYTRSRLSQQGLTSDLRVGDAEALPFPDASFDIVYSWGVLHHSPDTPKAISEALRVLRPGGIARVMIYHTYSITGYMLWFRYALMQGRPFRSLTDIYSEHLESPGTKAYTKVEAAEMFRGVRSAAINVILGSGDLLEGSAGQRHQGALLTIAKRIWPRKLIRTFLPGHGLFLTIEAVK